jgi:AcrR family transcriptional regulator
VRHTDPTSVSAVSNAPVPTLDDVSTTLLASASRLLADEGPGALTVRRIAAESGMSTMNVYSRFGGKQGVVEQLFLRGFALLANEMGAVPTTDDPVADMRACGAAYRRFALEHTTLYAVMFERVVPDYEPSDAALASGLATLQHLADRIQRCIDAGAFAPGPALHLAAMVWSTCHGAVSLELKQKLTLAIDWEAVFRDACENLVRGLSR